MKTCHNEALTLGCYEYKTNASIHERYKIQYVQYEVNKHFIKKTKCYDILIPFYSLECKEKSQNCTDSHP